jgi:hypothetical protein
MDVTSKSFLDVESDRTGLPSCPSSRLDFDQQGNQSSEEISRHITTSEPLPSSNRSDTMITPTAAPPMSMCSSAVDDDGRVSFLPQGRHAVPPLSLMERSTGLPAAPRKTPTSVSRLCFPFVTTSRRKKTPPSAPLPPTRHKYSCFPTKLSPFLAGRRAPVHQRHNYHHHGHSLLALEHVKSFWSMREDVWQGNTSPKAYGKISPSGITTVHLGTRLRKMDLTLSQQAPVPSIHPRHGDIPALRDPYCVEVDRHFISLPSWTLVKMLWTHDLHLAAESSTRLHIYWDEDISDSEPDWDISRSTSSCNFSDDSEATLVDSETESEISFSDQDKLVLDSRKFLSTQIKDCTSSIFTTPVVSPLLSPFPSQLDLEKNTQPPSAPVRSQSSSSKPSWATNWHNRWEILKGIHSTGG